MELDPRVFSFTEHYRNYPAVLVRLADVPLVLLADVVTEAWRHVSGSRRFGHGPNLARGGSAVHVSRRLRAIRYAGGVPLKS